MRIEITLSDTEESVVIEEIEDLSPNEICEYLHREYGVDGWLGYNII